jgi:hypothetical protein
MKKKIFSLVASAALLGLLSLLAVGTKVHAQLKKAATTAHSTTLTWTQGTVPAGATCPTAGVSAAVTGNNVYRGATSGAEGATPYASLTSPATIYTDTGVTPGATEFYEVTAVNCNGESGKSNEVSATTPNPAVPSAPTGLTETSQ